VICPFQPGRKAHFWAAAILRFLCEIIGVKHDPGAFLRWSALAIATRDHKNAAWLYAIAENPINLARSYVPGFPVFALKFTRESRRPLEI
jgi:hypothetical protein